MKRILSAVLMMLMLFCLTACQSNSGSADLEAMKLQMQLMQQQLDDAKQAGYEPSASASTQAPASESATGPASSTLYEDESGDPVLAFHATIDGETSAIIDGPADLTAVAEVPDGMAVDYWELNGEAYPEDMAETFDFSALGSTVVIARLRPEHKVTTINAEMQFLDKKGKPKGDAFTEFVFEEDYENPVTHETCLGDWITVYVKAVIPKGYAVDYWLINDVPYYYNRTVTSFTVHDLNETTVYEVVLKKENAPSSTPKPTAKPTQQPVYTPQPTQQPIYTPQPVTYYSVSCNGCVFSGGGYSGATGGSVPAGTVITVTSTLHRDAWLYWEGSIIDGDSLNGGGARSYSYTVNSDCSFKCNTVVN